MEITDDPQPEPAKDKPEEPKPSTPKIDSYMKFKAPTMEKSPKKKKTAMVIQKTPVKLDVLVETAMPSWSDNSNSEISKRTEQKAENINSQSKIEIMEIEDSEDMKLVYEETTDGNQKSPNDSKKSPEVPHAQPVDKKIPEKQTSPKEVGTPTTTKSNSFFTQAKVTDVKQPAVMAVQSPKAPRRVSFVTLSSPKNKKK